MPDFRETEQVDSGVPGVYLMFYSYTTVNFRANLSVLTGQNRVLCDRVGSWVGLPGALKRYYGRTTNIRHLVHNLKLPGGWTAPSKLWASKCQFGRWTKRLLPFEMHEVSIILQCLYYVPSWKKAIVLSAERDLRTCSRTVKVPAKLDIE